VVVEGPEVEPVEPPIPVLPPAEKPWPHPMTAASMAAPIPRARIQAGRISASVEKKGLAEA
jgi:hypothetical protein